jgi:hypothetical protein
MVLVNLEAPRHVHPSWSVTALPALSNIAVLSGSAAFAGLDAHRLLHNDSAPTALERSEGKWGVAQAVLGGPALSASLTSLVAAFDQHLAPARRQPRTRLEHWRAWSHVGTWPCPRGRWPANACTGPPAAPALRPDTTVTITERT